MAAGLFLSQKVTMRKIALFCCAVLCLTRLSATTWYVAPNGKDSNPGTLGLPFQTIPVAIAAAQPGDVIELRNGTYTSSEIRITKSRLTLRSYPGEWAVIAAPLDIEDISSCIWYSEPEVTGGLLERLEIRGGYYYGVSFETNWEWGGPANERRGASNITLRQCKIHDTGRDCIKIKPGCSNIQIIACEIYRSGTGPSNSVANGGPNAEGIDNVNGDGMLVRHCHIHDISTSGVYAKGGAKDCIIESNLVYNTGEAGILLGFYTDAEFFDQDGTNPDFYECQYSLARNNMVYNTGGAGIGFFAARNCSAYHNTVRTASPLFHAPLYLSPGDIWIDDNTTRTPSNFNIQVYNNIFIDQSGNGEEDFTLQIREGALSGVNLIDYNLYQKTGGPARFDDGVSWPGLNFTQWKTKMSMDAHSVETAPLLDSQLHLTAGSPAIDAARSSPATKDYDDQLRNSAPDLGADEFGNGPSLTVPPASGIIGTGAGGGVSATWQASNVPLIHISPNPATDYLQVFIPNVQLLLLELHDSAGRVQARSKDYRLSLPGLPAGNYFLSIYTSEGVTTTPIVLTGN